VKFCCHEFYDRKFHRYSTNFMENNFVTDADIIRNGGRSIGFNFTV